MMKKFLCDDAHGYITIKEAFAQSCDVDLCTDWCGAREQKISLNFAETAAV